jgi:uncharacterized membrane protein SirB2
VTLYLLIKYLHMVTVLLSISGFILRGIWMLQASPMLRRPLVRRLPHVNDTLLLASALVMAVMSGQYPFVIDWLTAKVVALLVYILLGMVAFRWGRSRGVKISAWLLAIVTFGYIVSVAMSRSATGFLDYF